MEELKQSLNRELSHVREVWFDQHGNWYIHKVPTAVNKMTREEILSETKPPIAPEERKRKGKNSSEEENKNQ